VALQQMPLLQAPSPVQRNLQTFTVSSQDIGASHAEPPSHRMSHVRALQSIPTPHALAFRHCTLQLEPAH
jgi:hypothetical protein